MAFSFTVPFTRVAVAGLSPVFVGSARAAVAGTLAAARLVRSGSSLQPGGLAIDPMAQVSQVQLVQSVLSILWAGLILREQIGWPTILGGLAVVACAGLAVRTRLGRRTAASAPPPALVDHRPLTVREER